MRAEALPATSNRSAFFFYPALLLWRSAMASGGSADIGAVLAGLRSASSEQRKAAAKRAAQLTDLNLLPAEEEATANSFHEAAAALARGGVCAALTAMLRVDKAEQQLACTALRSIFNVLHFLHNHRAALPARWASVAEDVTIPGASCCKPCATAASRSAPPEARPRSRERAV